MLNVAIPAHADRRRSSCTSLALIWTLICIIRTVARVKVRIRVRVKIRVCVRIRPTQMLPKLSNLLVLCPTLPRSLILGYDNFVECEGRPRVTQYGRVPRARARVTASVTARVRVTASVTARVRVTASVTARVRVTVTVRVLGIFSFYY